jgi:hypothetical protein
VRLLKEVKYFKQFNLEVPDESLQIYKKADHYREHVWTLDEIVFMYNRIQRELHKVERPLILSQIVKMDQDLEPGMNSLTWQNDISSFLKSSKTKVDKVYKTMLTMKHNLESITERLKSKRVIIYERNKTKTIRYEELQQALDTQYYVKKKEIEEELKKIHDD